MIDLTKTGLPSSIEVDGSLFFVKTDFQYWLQFSALLENPKAKMTDLFFIFDGKVPQNLKSAFDELCKFAFPKKEIPRSIGGSSVQVLDYSIDADLIYAAFIQQYHIDLLDEKLHLHWYKFQALMSGLHNTKLNEIMGYRGYDENKKSDYKKDMKELKKIWELPSKLSAQEQEDLDKFNALFEPKK